MVVSSSLSTARVHTVKSTLNLTVHQNHFGTHIRECIYNHWIQERTWGTDSDIANFKNYQSSVFPFLPIPDFYLDVHKDMLTWSPAIFFYLLFLLPFLSNSHPQSVLQITAAAVFIEFTVEEIITTIQILHSLSIIYRIIIIKKIQFLWSTRPAWYASLLPFKPH